MNENRPDRPTLEQLDRELDRRRRKSSYGRAFKGIIWVLVVVAAGAILCSTLLLTALQVRGGSMEPTFRQGEILLAARNARINKGDIVAFYYDNKILLKRVVATAGDEVDIRDDGTVVVNGKELSEPYLDTKSKGKCSTQLPCQVPDGRLFVLGDNREVSVDSRSSAIGCIAEKSVAGKVILCIWPLSEWSGF